MTKTVNMPRTTVTVYMYIKITVNSGHIVIYAVNSYIDVIIVIVIVNVTL